MYITDIMLTDLRCFRGTQAVSLRHTDGGYAGWTVFAGRNGAGKSTLLKAIALSVVGPLASRSLAGVFRGWAHRDAERAVAEVGVQRHDEDGLLSPKPACAEPLKAGLTWQARPGGVDGLERSKDTSKDTPSSLWAGLSGGWFLAAYGPYRHLGPAPAEVLRLSADPILARLVNLFYETATLSEAVDWLKQQHLRALEGREGAAALRDDVLTLLRDGLLPDGSQILRVDSDGLWVERDGVSLPLEQVSDGYRAVAALVVELLRRLSEAYGDLRLSEQDGHVCCPLPGVVLIDEIDAHLHVAWQQQIGFWLTQHFPLLQFLVTTHSPFICQAASPGGIIRLPAPGETEPLQVIPEEDWRAIVQGGADDAVMTRLFGLSHPHSARAEADLQALAAVEAKVIRGLATPDERAHYQILKGQVGGDLKSLADQAMRAVLRGDR